VDASAAAMDHGLLQHGNPIITADVMRSGVHGLVSLSIRPLMSPEHAQKVTDLLLDTLIKGSCPAAHCHSEGAERLKNSP